MEQRLREEAAALLEQGKVDCVVGFEPGTLRFTTTPLIIKDKDDAGRLVISPFIAGNLAKLLLDLKGRVGIVAKGCDSRSIVMLIQDNKLARENVVILGVPCSGIIDLAKVEKLVGRDRDEISDIVRDGDKVVVTVGESKRELPAADVIFDNCLACELPTPREYDILLGEPTSPVNRASSGKTGIERLKDMTPQQRWEYWKNEMGKCIRCYACRNVCPACYCQRCFVEESEPQWVLPAPRWQDNLTFQTVRAIHVAGRCTDCGECERVCPAHIPLRELTREMYDIVGRRFQFKAGMEKDAEPLMTHYQVEDNQDFIR